jgi:hypothetical protein
MVTLSLMHRPCMNTHMCICVCVCNIYIDDDPDEEAALDWHWLEREVESELAAADEANRRLQLTDAQADAAAALVPSAHVQTVAERHAARQAAIDEDERRLNSVLDEVDMELWEKLIGGIQSTRDELNALKAGSSMDDGTIGGTPSQVGRLLAEAEQQRGGASVHRAYPTPLRTLHDSNTIHDNEYIHHPYDQHGIPPAVYAVPLHSQRYEQLTTSASSDRIYQQHTLLYGQSTQTIQDSPSVYSFPRRPSPFTLNSSQQAQEASIRSAEYAGTYSTHTDAETRRHEYTNVVDTHTLTNPDAVHRESLVSPLPHRAVRPYEQWVKGEIQSAMTIPTSTTRTANPHSHPHSTPHKQPTTATTVHLDVNLMHSRIPTTTERR